MDRYKTPEARDGCSLCEEFGGSGGRQNERIEAFLAQAAPTGRILLESGPFVVVPSLGPLTVGHVLIVPREHYLSVGGLPPRLMEQLASVYLAVWDFLEDKFGQCMAFEHGCAEGGKRGGACVDHAHVHLLPAGCALAQRLEAIGRPGVIADLTELAQWHADGEAYLFYESRDRVKRVWSVGAIPSQLLRMLIAGELGVGDRWDWRADFGIGTFRSTIELFAELNARSHGVYVT